MTDIYGELQSLSENSSILIVDDSDEIVNSLIELFKMFFKEVDCASDGKEGFEKATSNKFNIIISDLEMPNMNGIEMITKIKEVHPNQRIIALSGYIDKHVDELTKLNVDAYMEKTYYVIKLFEDIIECLKKDS